MLLLGAIKEYFQAVPVVLKFVENGLERLSFGCLAEAVCAGFKCLTKRRQSGGELLAEGFEFDADRFNGHIGLGVNGW